MLVGGKHQRYRHEQIKRHEIDRQRIGQHTEQRRHQAGAEIGAGHLHADNGLGFVRAEVIRRRMDQTGIDGCAAGKIEKGRPNSPTL